MNIEEFRRNPYNLGCDFFERRYKNFGKRMFSRILLIPASQLLPPLKREGKEVRHQLSFCSMGSPGTGKTEVLRDAEKFLFNVISTQRITDSRFMFEVLKKFDSGETPITLNVSDASILLKNEEILKQLESLIGDNEISRPNMRNLSENLKIKIDGTSAILSGTFEGLLTNRRLRDGLVFRMLIFLNIPTSQENNEILKFVGDSIGKPGNNNNDDNIIQDFFLELKQIQEGEHATIKPITEIIFPEELRQELTNSIIPLCKRIYETFSIGMARAVEDGFRVASSHALIQIFNRTIIDGKLYIQKEDIEIAKKIIKDNIVSQFMILYCLADKRNLPIQYKLVELKAKMNVQAKAKKQPLENKDKEGLLD